VTGVVESERTVTALSPELSSGLAEPLSSRRSGKGAYSLLGMLLVFAAWGFVSGAGIVPETDLPAPWKVAATMVGEADTLLPDLWITAKAFLLALAMSWAVGVALGIGIVDSTVIGRVCYPVIVSLQVVPKITLGPLIMIWFGFGLFSTVLVGALIAVFPAVLSTVVGLRSAQPEKLYLAKTAGASWLRTLMQIRLPSALPDILPGARLAAILAILGVLVGEYIGADEGIGKRILEASASFDGEIVFAASAYVVLMGFGVFALMTLLDVRLTHWNRTGRHDDSR
jgi:NitT/TauT family transport system permease protein